MSCPFIPAPKRQQLNLWIAFKSTNEKKVIVSAKNTSHHTADISATVGGEASQRTTA
jgi:hypothetical protein